MVGWRSESTFYCSLSAHPLRQRRLGGVTQEDGVGMREKVKGSKRRRSGWVRNKGVVQSIETISGASGSSFRSQKGPR